ncbi:MAG TPA: hypothetical protein VL947_06105 [Cytophagales bacterium]|nr:hypothetical protein [Cytophagales bacterium]
MKKLAPIILIFASLVANAWNNNVLNGSIQFKDVDFNSEYSEGDSVLLRFVIVKDNNYKSTDSSYLTIQGTFRFDTLRFQEAYSTQELASGVEYVFKIAIPEMGTSKTFDPYVGANYSTTTALKIGTNGATPVIDNTIDSNKEVDYYLDLNGVQTSQPLGLVVVVYKDGSRSKALFN